MTALLAIAFFAPQIDAYIIGMHISMLLLVMGEVDFPTYALEAGFAPDAFQTHNTSGYYAAQQGNTHTRWVAFCGVKR